MLQFEIKNSILWYHNNKWKFKWLRKKWTLKVYEKENCWSSDMKDLKCKNIINKWLQMEEINKECITFYLFF